TADIVMVSPHFPDEPWVNLGISDEQKDLTTPKIMLWGMWVIHENKLTLEFLESKDMILVTREGMKGNGKITDTLAYIPNAQLRAAEKSIKDAYTAGNYDEVYRLFDQAYQFTPINGKDWLALKAKGEN
ncbi:MAG: hypothetical protein RR752_06940, partial [Mucinivorans sp.]